MADDAIKAQMNLDAVLQNLEDLIRLDAEMAELSKNWDAAIQFTVKDGPAAYVEFKNGACRHGMGRHEHPTIKLYFTSPEHLNRMFDGKANPIPLKGFTRLGFLKNEFTALTERLTQYLKPDNGHSLSESEGEISAVLTLNTAIYGCRDLAMLEPTCKMVAGATPKGMFQVEVLPDGPYIYLTFDGGNVSVAKGKAKKPMSKMTFRDLGVVGELLGGNLDAFEAVAAGDILLRGQIPMIDNVNILLDKVEGYLS